MEARHCRLNLFKNLVGYMSESVANQTETKSVKLNNMMRQLLYLFLLFSTAIVANAQPSGDGNEEIQSEYRQKIDIDYSMPDFSTSSLDESVIGTRLAKMLKVLKKNKSNFIFYNYLGLIQAEQIDGLDYCSVKSYKIENVSKHGDVINIKVKTKLNPNAKKIKTANLIISFKQGISDSQTANDLFSNLTDYIKD